MCKKYTRIFNIKVLLSLIVLISFTNCGEGGKKGMTQKQFDQYGIKPNQTMVSGSTEKEAFKGIVTDIIKNESSTQIVVSGQTYNVKDINNLVSHDNNDYKEDQKDTPSSSNGSSNTRNMFHFGVPQPETERKFNSFQEEMTNNEYLKLTPNTWNNINKKNSKLLNPDLPCDHKRKILSGCLNNIKGIEGILFSIHCYTTLDQLQLYYKKIYSPWVPKIEREKLLSNFAYLDGYFKMAIRKLHKKKQSLEKQKVFRDYSNCILFHGTSGIFSLESFKKEYHGPISTTLDPSVARSFAGKDGTIIIFKPNNKFVDVNWFGDYDEEEALFFDPKAKTKLEVIGIIPSSEFDFDYKYYEKILKNKDSRESRNANNMDSLEEPIDIIKLSKKHSDLYQNPNNWVSLTDQRDIINYCNAIGDLINEQKEMREEIKEDEKNENSDKYIDFNNIPSKDIDITKMLKWTYECHKYFTNDIKTIENLFINNEEIFGKYVICLGQKGQNLCDYITNENLTHFRLVPSDILFKYNYTGEIILPRVKLQSDVINSTEKHIKTKNVIRTKLGEKILNNCKEIKKLINNNKQVINQAIFYHTLLNITKDVNKFIIPNNIVESVNDKFDNEEDITSEKLNQAFKSPKDPLTNLETKIPKDDHPLANLEVESPKDPLTYLQMDAELGKLYKSASIEYYKNDDEDNDDENALGQFAYFFVDGEYEANQLKEELTGKPEDCMLIEFDDDDDQFKTVLANHLNKSVEEIEDKGSFKVLQNIYLGKDPFYGFNK